MLRNPLRAVNELKSHEQSDFQVCCLSIPPRSHVHIKNRPVHDATTIQKLEFGDQPAFVDCRPVVVLAGRKKTSTHKSFGTVWCVLQSSNTSATFHFSRSIRTLTRRTKCEKARESPMLFDCSSTAPRFLQHHRNNRGSSIL